jgi:hypothetical protein
MGAERSSNLFPSAIHSVFFALILKSSNQLEMHNDQEDLLTPEDILCCHPAVPSHLHNQSPQECLMILAQWILDQDQSLWHIVVDF